jgi:5-methylcytosine-specific restriction endonuclease McrA
MLYKVCPTCKEKYEHISKDSKCSNGCMNKDKKERNKSYDKFSRNKESASFYASKEWKKIRRVSMNRYNSLCVYSLIIDNKIVSADLVHHIKPLATHKELGLDVNNLIPLSSGIHSWIESNYTEDEENLMRELVNRYDKEYKVGG